MPTNLAQGAREKLLTLDPRPVELAPAAALMRHKLEAALRHQVKEKEIKTEVYRDLMANSNKYHRTLRSREYAKAADKKAKFKRDSQLYEKNHIFIEADKQLNTNILQPFFRSEQEINEEFSSGNINKAVNLDKIDKKKASVRARYKTNVG